METIKKYWYIVVGLVLVLWFSMGKKKTTRRTKRRTTRGYMRRGMRRMSRRYRPMTRRRRMY
jgi:hypothetical protein